ncbi:MAG: ATP phosphoribosyltransferase regulatory subunit [Gammaproteobacteria bacterium]
MSPASFQAGDGRWLLPEGIEELLPADARRVEHLRRELLDLFDRWGYELVLPPLIEYAESLLIGLGQDLELHTFKLTDQLSGRTLAVRPDITPQVARIDAHSLRRPGPARLCYAGSVLHTRPRSPLASRSPIQLGAELYGDASLAADLEIVCLMIEMLRTAGVQDITLDLGHVGIGRALMDRAGFPPELRAALFEALQRKADASIRALLAESPGDRAVCAMIGKLAALNGDRSVLEEASRVLAGAPPGVGASLAALAEVADALAVRLPGITLHFDLGELHGYDYHTGLVFAAYAPGQGEALANGGRYDDIGRVFGRARPATGFSADLKALLGLGCGESAAPRTAVFVPHALAGQAWPEVQRLRAAGERVVLGLPGESAPGACDRELRAAENGGWLILPL